MLLAAALLLDSAAVSWSLFSMFQDNFQTSITILLSLTHPSSINLCDYWQGRARHRTKDLHTYFPAHATTTHACCPDPHRPLHPSLTHTPPFAHFPDLGCPLHAFFDPHSTFPCPWPVPFHAHTYREWSKHVYFTQPTPWSFPRPQLHVSSLFKVRSKWHGCNKGNGDKSGQSFLCLRYRSQQDDSTAMLRVQGMAKANMVSTSSRHHANNMTPAGSRHDESNMVSISSRHNKGNLASMGSKQWQHDSSMFQAWWRQLGINEHNRGDLTSMGSKHNNNDTTLAGSKHVEGSLASVSSRYHNGNTVSMSSKQWIKSIHGWMDYKLLSPIVPRLQTLK